MMKNKRDQEILINQELKKADTILHELTSEMINNEQCINYYKAHLYDERGRGFGPAVERYTEVTPYEDKLRDLEDGEFIATTRELGKDVPFIRVEKRNDLNPDGKWHLYNVVVYERRKEILNCKTSASSVLREHYFHEPYHAFDNQANVWIPNANDPDPTLAIEFLSGKEPTDVTVEYARVELRNNIVNIPGSTSKHKVAQYVAAVHILDANGDEVAILDGDDLEYERIVKLDTPATSNKFQFKFDLDYEVIDELRMTATDLTSILRIEIANINLYEVVPYKIVV